MEGCYFPTLTGCCIRWLADPYEPLEGKALFWKILREEARGKRPADVEACIIKEVCSEPIHPSPDFQQLLWLLHSRQRHLHWELCSTAFRMMEDIWWAFGLAFVTGYLRTLTLGRCISMVFSSALAICFASLNAGTRSVFSAAQRCFALHLIIFLRLGGQSVFALQGGRSCSSSRWMPLVPLNLLPSSPACGENCRWLSQYSRCGWSEGALHTFRRQPNSTAGWGHWHFRQHRRAETAQTNTFTERPMSTRPCLQAQPHACNAFNAAPSGQVQSAQTGPQDQALDQAWPQQCEQGNQGIQPAQSQGARHGWM